MTQDTLLGFPAHTLPYRRGEFTSLLTVSPVLFAKYKHFVKKPLTSSKIHL